MKVSMLSTALENIDYAPGMRLIIRDEEWMVKKVETNALGVKTLHCTGISPLVKERDSTFLTDIEEIEQVDPTKINLVPDDSPFFRRSRLYIESGWRQKTPTDSALHVGHKAAMDTMQFQLSPARIALGKTRQRILIADTVGLGKTLEAGVLVSELIARGKGRRILVVTVKSMMTQFQKEMWNRFTIPLVRLDSNKIQRIRAELPSNYNPFAYYDKTIVSIDTIKRDVEYRTHLENSWWDIIIIDEAHNVAERGNQAQRARLAKLLAERSDTLIMLTATPHDGRSESFASLMNMLDPTAIADPYNYGKEDIKDLCVRRFKKDIKDQVFGAFKERTIHIEKCDASPAEERAYDVFTEMRLDMDADVPQNTGRLFKTSLEKSMFSSPAACIKSIEERLKKLYRRYPSGNTNDIRVLEELKKQFETIAPTSFSRYQKLKELLTGKPYGWTAEKNDRVVIFTERIETMRYLAAHLKTDLHLEENAVQEIYGGMTDIEQQQIVEDFGREESPMRILVASDVASEGINLHYLCHRVIHFDIPWSLMVFQQRNGRIDRYGQPERPNIRYFMISSVNEKIKGDTRIMEILINKEEQANKNIGDPMLLMGKFNIEDEEQMTAEAIEAGVTAENFELQLDTVNEEFDPFEALMASVGENENLAQAEDGDTLFTDVDYVSAVISFMGGSNSNAVKKLQTVNGVEITVSPDLRRRLTALLPPEVVPKEDYLRLSPDKAFCMAEMKRSMQNHLSETAWPATQFLWKLHPLFIWLNDKAGLFFGRNEAPLIGLSDGQLQNQCLFIIAGAIPNRKSSPVIDEWFALLFEDGRFRKELSMNETLIMTKIGAGNLPNRNIVTFEMRREAEALLPEAVDKAKEIMQRHCDEYKKRIDPLINEELDKLAGLQTKHEEYRKSLFEDERRKTEQVRIVDRIFDNFADWVKDTLEIENNPYIRVVAAMIGGGR
jgi:superfamily II DNA or RNA helicase